MARNNGQTPDNVWPYIEMSGKINFTSAIEQTYDWTNYFKHKIIFCKIFPIVLALFISDDRLNILFLLIYINNEKSTLCKAHLSKQ